MGVNLQTFLFLLGMVLSYYLLSGILGINFSTMVEDLKHFAQELMIKSSDSLTTLNEKRLQTQSVEERKKSWRYKWYRFSSTLITDMGWNGDVISPEKLFIWTFLASFGVVVLLSGVVTNNLIKPILLVTVDVWIFAILYLISRMRSKKRYKAILKAEDLICQNITSAPQTTIIEITSKVDDIIRKPFDKFRFETTNANKPFTDAITELNLALGPRFDDVCEKMIKLHEEGKPGMEDTFKDNLEKNALTRKLNIVKERVHREMNVEFIASLTVLVLMFVYTFFSFDNIHKFYLSTLGQLVILIYLIIIVGVFCYTQYLQSQDYK